MTDQPVTLTAVDDVEPCCARGWTRSVCRDCHGKGDPNVERLYCETCCEDASPWQYGWVFERCEEPACPWYDRRCQSCLWRDGSHCKLNPPRARQGFAVVKPSDRCSKWEPRVNLPPRPAAMPNPMLWAT